MKNLLLCLLVLALALAMPAAAAADALTVSEEIGLEADPVQMPEEVCDLELEPDPLLADEEIPGEIAAPEELPDPGETDPDATSPEVGDEAPGEDAEAPAVFGDPIPVKTVSVTKNATKSVYLGIGYALNVKGGIKSVKSSAKGVATADVDGTLTLKKKGTAKLTITRNKGKKLTLTLKVKATPAPGSVKVKCKNNTMTLNWTAAKYATRHLVQTSTDGEEWVDYRVLDGDSTSLDVTDTVTGPIFFRVVAVLGDCFGGASDAVSVLGPISGVKVICQESWDKGPTNRMNVTWKACAGVTGYEVYHTELPSDDYSLIGTTDKTWFPVTRSATRLDAYRVKPVFGELDLPMSDPVTLWSGLQENVLPPSSLTSSSGIILVVNKQAQVVTAYVKDENGRYTIPLRHMICSTGKTYERTKNGTYKLKSREGEWYRYPSGCYIRWPSIYRDGYYFHSVLYKSKSKIYNSTIEKLGTRQSAGCIRMKVRDAEWVYKNCPKGTAVYICDGTKKNKLKNALLPRTVKVSGF